MLAGCVRALHGRRRAAGVARDANASAAAAALGAGFAIASQRRSCLRCSLGAGSAQRGRSKTSRRLTEAATLVPLSPPPISTLRTWAAVGLG